MVCIRTGLRGNRGLTTRFGRSFRFGGKTQAGVSLLLALIFVIFFGGLLVTLSRFNSYEIRKAEARVSGWELVEIGKAARLYVRDRYAANPSLVNTATTPSLISLNTLRSNGYLSQSFGRTAAGSNLTALNQRIYVIMANWSPTGLGGAPGDPATVPSAFVYFDQSASKSTPGLAVNVAESARLNGAVITAPLFDSSGNNRSADCRGGGPAVGLWDTGCMTAGEFTTMANAVGIPSTFTGGSIIMPAWKAIQPDLRAVMRFPQPENPGFATMLTDLQMGTPVGDCSVAANQVTISTTNAAGNVVSQTTGVCDVVDDTGAANNRFNISRIGRVTAERVIAEAQTQDFGGDASSIGTGNDDVLRVTGNVDLGSDLRVYRVRPLPTGVTHRFNVPNGSLAVERNSYLYSQNIARSGIATIGTITEANALITDTLDTDNFISTANGTTSGAPQINVTSTTDIRGDMRVTGTGASELITETMTAPNANVRATGAPGQVQVANSLQMGNSTMTVNGSYTTSGYSTIIGEITNAGTVTADNNLTFGSSSSLRVGRTQNYNGTNMPQISTTGRCLESTRLAGGCPERQYFPPGITP